MGMMNSITVLLIVEGLLGFDFTRAEDGSVECSNFIKDETYIDETSKSLYESMISRYLCDNSIGNCGAIGFVRRDSPGEYTIRYSRHSSSSFKNFIP